MLTPPLDRIPQIPPQLARMIIEEINKLLDKDDDWYIDKAI